jgi:hypothetical protein
MFNHHTSMFDNNTEKVVTKQSLDHIRCVLATAFAEQETKGLGMRGQADWKLPKQMQQCVHLTGSTAGKTVAGGVV